MTSVRLRIGFALPRAIRSVHAILDAVHRGGTGRLDLCVDLSLHRLRRQLEDQTAERPTDSMMRGVVAMRVRGMNVLDRLWEPDTERKEIMTTLTG